MLKMTTPLTSQAKIERLAAFMIEGYDKWHLTERFEKAEKMLKECDWNLWRDVEEKVMEYEELSTDYCAILLENAPPKPDIGHAMYAMMKATLPERVDALLLAIDSHEAETH